MVRTGRDAHLVEALAAVFRDIGGEVRLRTPAVRVEVESGEGSGTGPTGGPVAPGWRVCGSRARCCPPTSW